MNAVGIGIGRLNRLVSTALLSGLLVLAPIAQCLADCCCDDRAAEASAVAETDPSPQGHCHAVADGKKAYSAPESTAGAHGVPDNADAPRTALESSCPCSEHKAPAHAIEFVSVLDIQLKIQLFSGGSLRSAHEAPDAPCFQGLPDRSPGHIERPIFIRLSSLRI